MMFWFKAVEQQTHQGCVGHIVRLPVNLLPMHDLPWPIVLAYRRNERGYWHARQLVRQLPVMPINKKQ